MVVFDVIRTMFFPFLLFLTSFDCSSSFQRSTIFDLSVIPEYTIFGPEKLLEKLHQFPHIENITVCLAHVAVWSYALLERKKWALEMVDSISKIPSGLLSGNVIQLGDYEECISVTSAKTNSDFDARYCLAKFILLYENETSNPFHEYVLGGETSLTFSICVPSTCQSQWIQHAVNETVSILPVERGLTLNFNIPTEDCYVRLSENALSVYEWIIAIALLGVVILVVVATYVDNKVHRNSSTSRELQALLAFSLSENIQKLFDLDTSKDTFPAVHGLKVISTVWILFAERFQFLGKQPVVNIFDLLDMLKNWSTMVILSAPLSADTFLVISGFLNSYLTLQFFSCVRKHTIIRYVLKYIRITPPFAATIGASLVILKHLKDGPMWNRVVNPDIENCEKFWYSNLLYISNYYNPKSLCLSPTWYLSVYMQLYALSPIVLFPLFMYPILGICMLGISAIASAVIPFYVAYTNHFRTPIPFSRNMTEIEFTMEANYVPTHMRFSSYLIGLAAGFLVCHLQRRQENFTIPNAVRAFCSAAVAIGMAVSVFSCYWLYQVDVPYNRLYSSLYISLHRPVWAIGIAWLLIASCSTSKGLMAKALSAKFFIPVSKLAYCIFLVHYPVLLYQFGTVKTPFYFSVLDQLQQVFGNIVFDLALAVVLHLLFEAPFLNLIQTYCNRLDR